MKPFKSPQWIAFLTLALSAFGLYVLTQGKTEEPKNLKNEKLQLAETLEKAQGLLQENRPLQALEVLNAKSGSLIEHPSFESKWKKLALESLNALEDDQKLFQLWSQDPEALERNEAASLKVASFALSQYDLSSYDKIAKEWSERKSSPEWQLLDADASILRGEIDNAFDLLATPLSGDGEIKRLVRLALLNENEHPQVAWNYLLQALNVDPSSADLRLYRAEVLESQNRADLASREYEEAVAKSQADPFYTDVLIDFYMRQGKYHEALLALENKPQSSKKIFLNKVYKPDPQNNMGQIASYLPEAEWLKVFDQLKAGSETLALNTLQTHPEMEALNPPLYYGLQKVILLRHPNLGKEDLDYFSKDAHPLFAILSQPELPQNYKALIGSKEAYGALAMASGWFEAALDLQKWVPGKKSQYTEIPREFPNWVAYGFAKALIANRSSDDALAFISKQTPTPQLALLAAELNFQKGNLEEAENALSRFSRNPTPLGVKSALLLAKLYDKQRQFTLARQVILNNPELANSLSGKEMLARLELKFGNPALAENLYAEIAESSTEAKSFFAKKAFQEGDYQKAYRLTKALSDQFPDRPELKAQLEQIKEAASH